MKLDIQPRFKYKNNPETVTVMTGQSTANVMMAGSLPPRMWVAPTNTENQAEAMKVFVTRGTKTTREIKEVEKVYLECTFFGEQLQNARNSNAVATFDNLNPNQSIIDGGGSSSSKPRQFTIDGGATIYPAKPTTTNKTLLARK